MNIKARTLTLLASTSLVVLLTALFVPVFCVFLGFLTLSVWDLSPLVALSGAAIMSALILMPLVRPSMKAWLFPFLLGLALVISALCAAVYSFPLANDLSNLLFHPYGLILFAIGGLLCIIEGVHARSQARLTLAA